MFNFLHTFHPNPILFTLGPVAIHWYGLLVVLGIVAGIAVATWLAKKYGIKSDQVIDLAFWLVIFGLLGGRLYAVFLFADYYFSHPLEIFAVWRGGLAIHGAIIAGAITLWVYAKKKQQSFWQWADIVVVALALGQAIGRWGNYFNQELFGKPTSLPWGIPIDIANRPQEFLQSEFFHPTFLYESLLNLVVFGILLTLHLRRIKKDCHPDPAAAGEGSPGLQYGIIALIYLILYSAVRIGLEFLRIDETPAALGVRWPIVVSGMIILAAIWLMIQMRKKVHLEK